MTTLVGERWRSQARATCCGVAPNRVATFARVSDCSGVKPPRGKNGPNVDDLRLKELVGDLSVRSERFRQLWARHDVRRRKGRMGQPADPSGRR
jgi:MmyB-like transcription regulator ligand binding domain